MSQLSTELAEQQKEEEDFAKENSADISKDILVETQNFVIGILMPLLVILSQSFICISILIALFLFDAFVASLVTLSILLIFGIFYFLIQKPLQKEGAERFKATVERFKIVVSDYNTTAQTPEALYRLTESYLSLGIITEAKKTTAVLSYNFKESNWYKLSYDLFKKYGYKKNGKKG